MKSTIQAPKSREELNEELTALKLKIALQEYQAESLETILADEPGDSSAREQLARSEKLTLRRLNRRLRRRSHAPCRLSGGDKDHAPRKVLPGERAPDGFVRQHGFNGVRIDIFCVLPQRTHLLTTFFGSPL